MRALRMDEGDRAPLAPSLPRLLDAAAGAAAQAVEEAPLVRLLRHGQLGRSGLVSLLRCLQAVYGELEWALEWNRRHPEVRPLCLPPLWRNEPLQDALRALCGPHWHDVGSLGPAAPHCERLTSLCAEAPGLLAAHAWALYVADPLGRALAATRMLRPPALFQPSAGPLRRVAALGTPCATLSMRHALERLDGGAGRQARLADEARRALRLQRWMLDELRRTSLPLVAL